MTEITERRLKCDYCGNVSPVLENDEMPMGWKKRSLSGFQKRKKSPDGLPVMLSEDFVTFHFCTESHYRDWRGLSYALSYGVGNE